MKEIGYGIQEEDWVDGAGIIPVTQRLTVISEDASVWENTYSFFFGSWLDFFDKRIKKAVSSHKKERTNKARSYKNTYSNLLIYKLV